VWWDPSVLIVTTNEIPGYRIEAVLGEVMGITVRSANFAQSFTAGFRALGGGEVTEFTRLVYETRYEVMVRLRNEATARGANAIVGMCFDNGSIGTSFSEVCAYGTAVVVRPIAEGDDATPQSTNHARHGVEPPDLMKPRIPGAPQQPPQGHGQPYAGQRPPYPPRQPPQQPPQQPPGGYPR